MIQVFALRIDSAAVPRRCLGRGIEGDRDVEILRLARRPGEPLAAREKIVFFEQTVFVPNRHVLAELFEREGERELTAKRVAIRANVAENGKPLMRAQDAADLRESALRHSVSARRRLDLLQNFKDARAALDRIVEMEDEMRRVFQGDALREGGLKDDPVLLELRHRGGLAFLLPRTLT